MLGDGVAEAEIEALGVLLGDALTLALGVALALTEADGVWLGEMLALPPDTIMK